MGKAVGDGQGPDGPENGIDGSSGVFFRRRSEVIRRICNAVTPRCAVFLLLGSCVFLSAVFWLPPLRGLGSSTDSPAGEGFSASIEASFILQKPLSMVSSYTAQLEYDIFEEIGVPKSKVSIVDLRSLTSTNDTYVAFGVLPNPDGAVISPIALSVLRSSLIELVLQQSNLSLTASIFGHVSSFEVIRFPGGITVVPVQSASIWQMSQVLFNFTLNNSISQIRRNLEQLKGQLKGGLNLKSYENVFVQMTNLNGSSAAPPVIVEASVLSDVGSRNLLPPRLKQLAKTITAPPKNFGLDHAVFGKVNEVRLSSYLNDSITSVECPSPSPSRSYGYPSYGPSLSPSLSPASAPPLPPPPLPSAPPRKKRRAPPSQNRPRASPKIAPFPSPAASSAPRPSLAAPPPKVAHFPAPPPRVDRGSRELRRDADSPAAASSSPPGAQFLLDTWLLGLLLGSLF